jgi:tight adherence protein C
MNRLTRWWENKRKIARISSALPETIDLVALVLQAGLDFQMALAQSVIHLPCGPLRDELALVQNEIRTGASRVDALRNLARRTPSPDLREIASSILQGLELGSSLAPLLRRQARVLRTRRALEAEKRAALAPLKLLFPLFVFIFPTLFIVLFGPVVLAVMKGHGS